MRLFSILILMVCSTAALAADLPVYLPLEVGNLWVLQTASSGPELLTVEVHRSRTINGQTWFLVSGYAAEDRWIRTSAEGTVYALDERTGNEETLADLRLGANPYPTSLSGCRQSARAAEAPAAYAGPHFSYDASLSLAYGPEACRDIGITAEIYAPSVGLVRRSITTIRGELTFDLVYARIAGQAIAGRARELVLPYHLQYGSKGWLPGFTDYNLRTGDLRMLAELRPLPDEIGGSQSAFYIQSMNRSDDLFMFVKKEISTAEGLEPNAAYRLSFDIRLASNAPAGCSGVGGAPGEGVYLKAGASADEPVPTLDPSGDIRLNIDKGDQAAGGKDAGVAGTLENGTACEGSAFPYVRIRRVYSHAQTVRTDDRGSLWLVVGTDSAFEGLTGLYIESITVRVNSAAEPPTA